MCNFWLFPVKDNYFELIEDIKAVRTVHLKTLTKKHFQNCFGAWKEQWAECVRSERRILRESNANVSFTVITCVLI